MNAEIVAQILSLFMRTIASLLTKKKMEKKKLKENESEPDQRQLVAAKPYCTYSPADRCDTMKQKHSPIQINTLSITVQSIKALFQFVHNTCIMMKDSLRGVKKKKSSL
jgi:hypothetical protein